MPIVPLCLSASTDGRSVPVVATATAGTTIHTGSSTATDYDEIFIDAVNIDTMARVLTIEWGSAAVGDNVVVTIPVGVEPIRVIPGWRIKGNASTALVVKAFCAGGASVINLNGYVNRYSA